MFLVAMLMPFVMHAQTNDVTTITQNEVACDSFHWTVNDSTYTASGIYFATLHDTAYVLNLQLNYNSTNTISEPISAGCLFVWGDTIIRESGTYTKTFATTEQCDSIVTMTINITDTAYISSYDTVCKEFVYSYNNTIDTISVESVMLDTVLVLKSVIDTCPTVDTLRLNIIPPRQIYYKDSVEACDKYLFTFVTGTANFAATTSMDTTTATLAKQARYKNVFHPRTVEKCFDSTYHLKITIRESVYSQIEVEACDLAEYLITYIADNGRERDSLFQYVYSTTDTIKRVAKIGRPESTVKCDSNVVLNVTVNRSPAITINGPTAVQPGESVTLTASSNQDNMSWAWSNGSNGDSITTPPITANTDVTLTGTNTVTNCSSETSITILCNVGIDEAKDQQVVIYPNPATAFVNIESAHAISSISIYNAVGQTVYAAGAQGTKATMDVSNYANGTYMMRLVLANGTEVVRTMIVKK